MKIGIFDSGIGGEALRIGLAKEFPDASFITCNDKENLPYGDKPARKIISLTKKAISPMLSSGCDVIIIACNTATALTIDSLRKEHPDQVFIGLEPMIKPGAKLTKTKSIAVCATPATLKSQRYKLLKKQFASDIKVFEPDCSKWAYMIENNQVKNQRIASIVNQAKSLQVDVLILGCTHYYWIDQLIKTLAGKDIEVIEPTSSIAKQVRRLLAP